MSTAATAPPTVVRSSSRRQQQSGAPQRTPSGSGRPAAAPSDQARPDPASYHARSERDSMSQQQPPGLNGVARRDYETTNLARSPTNRRSSSRDAAYQPQPAAAPPPAAGPRNDGQPLRTSSRHAPARYSSDMGRAPSSATRGVPPPAPASAPPQHRSGNAGYDAAAAAAPGSVLAPAAPVSRRRTQVEAQTGVWSLGKTIGAGSMGKVKLARNVETGEQVRVLLHQPPQ